ncbi:hypothetical protein Mal35_36620 [Gimesia maris]|nr:hypothetical protein Mal35_36620 [Gimesia maris]
MNDCRRNSSVNCGYESQIYDANLRVHHPLTENHTPVSIKIVSQHMHLTSVEKSLVLAAFYRGGSPDDQTRTSNVDQILTLSLFYTEEMTSEECVSRFAQRSYVKQLYSEEGELTEELEARYQALIRLIQEHPELIEGNGDFALPADPTFTACRLTGAGLQLAVSLFKSFPLKPDFPDWPDQRTMIENN